MAFAVKHGPFQYVKARRRNVTCYVARRDKFKFALGDYIAVNAARDYNVLASYFRLNYGCFADSQSPLRVEGAFETSVYSEIHGIPKSPRPLHRGINIKNLFPEFLFPSSSLHHAAPLSFVTT